MSEQNSQEILSQNKKQSSTKEPGGFMAIYHDVEEICYGPDSGMPANARVFMCIRHKLLRDGLCEKLIGKAFIMEKTGLTLGQVKLALKYLEQKEIILVHRSKTGKIWNESKYELNPKKFGALYNWYKNNPTVRIYNGSKSKKSYPQVGSDPTPGVGSYSALGVVPDSTPGKLDKLSDLIGNMSRKNPSLITHKNNNPSETKDVYVSKGTKKQRTKEEHEAMVREQVAMMKAGKL